AGVGVRVSPGRPDRTAAELGRALASSPTPVVLVLDDADHLRDTESIRLVRRVVDELPAGSQLVLLSSDEPALPLARLRARGLLFDVGTADLRFGDREASSLLQRAGAILDEAGVETLNAQVEGWPLGLSFLAQSLASTGAVATEPLLEHLRREVLARLPGDD